MSVITDWDGNPRCVIRTTNIKIIPFKDITYDIAKLEDLSAFAGSTASGDSLVRTVYKGCNIPRQDAVYMMTVTPAKMINVFGKKCSIEVGKDADLIVFDDDVNVSSTYVMGENIY